MSDLILTNDPTDISADFSAIAADLLTLSQNHVNQDVAHNSRRSMIASGRSFLGFLHSKGVITQWPDDLNSSDFNTFVAAFALAIAHIPTCITTDITKPQIDLVSYAALWVNAINPEVKRASLITRKATLAMIIQRAGRDNFDPNKGLLNSVTQSILRERPNDRKGANPITQSVVHDLIAAIKTDEPSDLRDRAQISLAYWAALRSEELCSLLIEDVQVTTTGISVNITGSKTDQQQNGETITIPLTVDGKDLRKEAIFPHLHLLKWMQYLKMQGFSQTDPLFPSFKDRSLRNLRKLPMSTNAFRATLEKYGRLAGYANLIKTHGFRKGFATDAQSAGANIQDLMKVGRWADPNTPLKHYDGIATSIRQAACYARVASLL